MPAAALAFHDRDAEGAVGGSSSATPIGSGSARSTALVAYHGKQAEAFAVAWVPSGWTSVASDTTSVVIAPKQNATSDPQTMNETIEISALSDDNDPRHGRRAVFEINGREAYLSKQSLSYQAPTGRWIHIQLPDSLTNWTPAQIRSFAEGITVGNNLGHSGG